MWYYVNILFFFYFFFNILRPCIDSMIKVDMRTVAFDVPPQEVLTQDSVSVSVDAVVYNRDINTPVKVEKVENSKE